MRPYTATARAPITRVGTAAKATHVSPSGAPAPESLAEMVARDWPYRLTTPSRQDEAGLAQGLTLCRDLGLEPPRGMRVLWFRDSELDRRGDVKAGKVIIVDGAPVILLRVGMPLPMLVPVVGHELQHVIDTVSGADQGLTDKQNEARAEKTEWRVRALMIGGRDRLAEALIG